MKISFAKNEHKKSLLYLWQHCFHDDDAFCNFWFCDVFNPQNTIIAENECGEIIGSLQIIYCKLNICGRLVSSAYICGVGVSEKYRRKKIATQLIKYCEEYLKKSGIQFIFLISEADRLYYSLGYEPYFSRMTYEFPPFDLNIRNFNAKANYSDALNIYNSFCSGFSCFCERSEDDFRLLDSEYKASGGRCLTLYSNNIPKAYIAYYTENGTIYADETGFCGKYGAELIIQFIYSLSAKNCIMTASKNSVMPDLLYPNSFKAYMSKLTLGKCISETLSKDDFNLPNADKLSHIEYKNYVCTLI